MKLKLDELQSELQSRAPVSTEAEDQVIRQKQQQTESDMVQLCEWLQTGGAELNKIRVWYFSENYRGIQLSEACGIKELLLFVPRKFIITYEDGQNYPIFKSFKDGPNFQQLK